MKLHPLGVCGELPLVLTSMVAVTVALTMSLLSTGLQSVPSPTLDWSELPPVPDPIGWGGPIVGVHSDVLIVAGGANFPDDPPWPVNGRPSGTKVWHDRIYILSGDRQNADGSGARLEWKSRGRLPYPLAYAATVSTPEGVYVLGGESYGQPVTASAGAATMTNYPTREVLRIEVATDAGTLRVVRGALPDLPKPCQYHAAALVGTRLFVVASHAASPESLRLDSSSFWCLDLAVAPDQRRWEDLPVWPGAAREKMAFVAQTAPPAPGRQETQHLYLIGGSTWARHPDGTPDDARATHFADGFRYGPAARTWTPLAELPFVPERRAIDTTGFHWNAAAHAWQPAADAPSLTPAEHDQLFRSEGRPLGAAPALAWGDRYILLCSGATGRYVTLPTPMRPDFPRDVLVFDTQTERWTTAGEMPVGVVTTTAVEWRGQIVIPSGEVRPGIRTPRVQAARLR